MSTWDPVWSVVEKRRRRRRSLDLQRGINFRSWRKKGNNLDQ